MRICNLARFGLFVLCTVPLSAAATLKKEAKSALSMPSSPSMPAVVMPGLGSGFYVPGARGFYSGTNPYVPKKTDSKADSKNQTADSEKNTSENAGNSGNSILNPLTALTSAGNFSQLTASDISSLDSMGVLGSLGGLLGGTGKNSGLLNSTNGSILVNQNSQDSKTLEAILEQLTDLKKQVSVDGQVPKTENTAFTNVKKVEPKILRFSVNGRDLISSCRKVYFSEQESDGTFLLTGDRKYTSENKAHDETFYFYFHSCGGEGGVTRYKVTPAISQDMEDKNSCLYELTQKNELEAQRTGNLVTLRASQGDWKMDVLLSLDK